MSDTSVRRCANCHKPESEVILYFVSFGPGQGGIYCKPCGDNDHPSMVSR